MVAVLEDFPLDFDLDLDFFLLDVAPPFILDIS